MVNGMGHIGIRFSIILMMHKKEQIVKQLIINKNVQLKLGKFKIKN